MLKKILGEPTGREFFLQSLGLGTPGQNQMTQTANNTNAVNQAFADNTQNTNNSLAFLQNWLGVNPSPVSGWGNITPPTPVAAGATIGGGTTNDLGQLVTPPATANNPLPAGLGGTPRTAANTRTTQPVARAAPAGI
jgi:hypothetical protein